MGPYKLWHFIFLYFHVWRSNNVIPDNLRLIFSLTFKSKKPCRWFWYIFNKVLKGLNNDEWTLLHAVETASTLWHLAMPYICCWMFWFRNICTGSDAQQLHILQYRFQTGVCRQRSNYHDPVDPQQHLAFCPVQIVVKPIAIICGFMEFPFSKMLWVNMSSFWSIVIQFICLMLLCWK